MFARGSATKVFVGGLSYDRNETVLRDAFQQFGDIIEATVICDHVSGKSKDYGFVRFNSETAAAEAMEEMDGRVSSVVLLPKICICIQICYGFVFFGCVPKTFVLPVINVLW
ncbi:glycine-rich RNA-binding protein 2, mitochondrial-like [Punica granatum]|uniref:Glycine-rich RNA-binding protein 2, mitochondrial-like n=1 Tax=Punica granatum TaxID=22663 RepID=A0A6P8E177_PUNGR|nr:glycine-rich RNA-binding protein 2, mitochondrial-like [Punica granatum]